VKVGDLKVSQEREMVVGYSVGKVTEVLGKLSEQPRLFLAPVHS